MLRGSGPGLRPRANSALLRRALTKLASLKMRRYCSKPIHSNGNGEPSRRLVKEMTTAKAKGTATKSSSPIEAGAAIASAVERSFHWNFCEVFMDSGNLDCLECLGRWWLPLDLELSGRVDDGGCWLRLGRKRR